MKKRKKKKIEETEINYNDFWSDDEIIRDIKGKGGGSIGGENLGSVIQRSQSPKKRTKIKKEEAATELLLYKIAK
jgi:hypothetical protein